MTIDQVSDRLAWLGGADLQVLQKVPAARMRFVQMAGVLLTTSGLAVLSMSFALHDGLRVSWLAAVPFGFIWGFIILNLDRFLVLSMGAARNLRQLLLMAAPRLAMAVVLAAVISTPLVMRVFSSDIKNEVFVMQLERSAAQKELEANSNEQYEANKLAQEIAEDKNIIAGHLQVDVTSPALATAQANVTRLQTLQQQDQTAANEARATWQCELYGSGPNCAGASNKPGPGPIAQAKKLEYEQKQGALNSVNSQLQQAQAAEKSDQQSVGKNQGVTLRAEQKTANAQLPGLEKQHNELIKLIQGNAAQGTKDNQNGTGILTQMQALAALSKQSSTVEATHIAVGLLFFLIEILPVMVKILLSICPDTAYEVIAKAKDDTLMDEARIQRAEDRLRAEDASRARVHVEADMRKREEALGKRANEHVAREMTGIIDLELRKWSQLVRGQVAAGSAQAAPGIAGPTAGTLPARHSASQPAASGSASTGPAPMRSPAGGSAVNGSATNGSALNRTAVNGSAVHSVPSQAPPLALPDEEQL
jgi:hypothetical protein